VEPVTRGTRVCSFFWVQSMVRDDARRAMLHELDQTIQRLRVLIGDVEEIISLTSHYHNLLRSWAEV
jgi:PKHD-type hydroxylase